MGTSVGDVVVGLRLDSGGFDAGTASALRSAQRLGQIVDQFGRPMGAVARISDDAAGAISRTGAAANVTAGHMESVSRSTARFAAIGVQQLIPALDGSRVALEGAIQGISRLTSGYGLLALGGIGAAAAIGGAFYLSLRNTEQGTRDTVKGVVGLDDTIGKLEKQIDDNIESLSRWRDAASAVSGAETSFNLFPEDAANMARAQIDSISARITRLRDQIEKLKGAKLLEDPAAGPAGSIAKSLESDRANKLEQLDKDINKFLASARIGVVEDPLAKMLINDYQRTQDAINAIRELTFLTEEERNKRIGDLAEQGGKNQIAIRAQETKVGQADLAARLGLGDTNLLGGFGQLKQLTKDVDQFSGAIRAMAQEGVPVRDLFPQIAEGQEKFNDKITALKDKYRDVPAIFNQLVELEKRIGNNDLQKDLDAQVRSLAGVKQGTVTLIDTAEGLEKTYIPALSNAGLQANFLAAVMQEDLPAANATAGFSVITLTVQLESLRDHFARAALAALFLRGALIGDGQTSAVPGPGNFE